MSPDDAFQIAGVELTNPDRLLFPEMGATKRQLAEYYDRVADWIMPHVAGRPLTLVRCPRGHEKKCFYQKHYDDGFPEPVLGLPLLEKDRQEATYILIHELPGLVGLVQVGVLELHPWGSRAEELERPDRLVFDLDPGEVPWEAVVSAAREVRERLAALGLRSFVKTSGGKGLHVVLPLQPGSDWETLHSFAAAFAKSFASQDPERYVATASKAERAGKVFIDYLRNTRGATNVAAYSTRAKPGAPVSTPLRWEELSGLESPQAYDMKSVPRRLGALRSDPWEGFFELRQSISEGLVKEIEIHDREV